MEKICIHEIVSERYPSINKYPGFLKTLFFFLLQKIMCEKEINAVLKENKDQTGIIFIDGIFEQLNFSFSLTNKDVKKIPSEGRLICVANHPIGSLDALSLMKAIYEIRADIKVVANEILYSIPNLREFMLPFELDSRKMQKQNILAIGKALEEEKAVIIFPAAEVSRLKGLTVSDSSWHKGAVYFARKHNSPILPVRIKAKNSAFFYFISVLNKKFSRVFLVRELFNKRNKTITLKIGDPIPNKVFSSKVISDSVTIKLLQKHVFNIGRKKKSVFITEKNIVHPSDRKLIKHELRNGIQLGTTPDNKRLILLTFDESPNVMSEIGRLREVTFRKVGEGTGHKIDIDQFDKYYKHLVVWDDEELEIVGSYRIGIGNEILEEKGLQGFYTSTLFNFSDEFTKEILSESIELGRSFIQKKYWNSNALHYLWLGIGAYISLHKNVKYMFGPVSISNNYPDITKQMIVYYYQKWFGSNRTLAASRNQFRITHKVADELMESFRGSNADEDYNILKRLLKPYGFIVPMLFKHYSNLCEKNGVKYLDFGIDPDFNNCIDGLILVELGKLKEDKRKRYIDYFVTQNKEEMAIKA